MKTIYLDHAATTPIDKKVAKIMCKYLYNDNFGNASSNTHHFGWKAKQAIEEARINVAKIINAKPKEIIFTSGATESNNLAIKGVAFKYQTKPKHIITSSIEHKTIINTCLFLKQQGFQITFIHPDKKGQINAKQIKQAICNDTILISLMAINNELGTYYPIEEISKIANEKNILFHVDAAQGVGKINIDVKKTKIDLLSISGHKMYGPKGIGALYVKNKIKIRIKPLFHGGNQEMGIRSGTLATHQIVGLGKACEIMQKDQHKIYKNITQLRNQFIKKLKNIPTMIINTPLNNSYPGIVNITFQGIDGESLVAWLHKLAISMGSACTSSTLEPSHVLTNIGLNPIQAHSSLRFSFGKDNNMQEINVALSELINAVNTLHNLSP